MAKKEDKTLRRRQAAMGALAAAAPAAPRKKKKKKHTDSHQVCIECPALCCQDLSIPWKKPKNENDVIELKWFLHFELLHVYIRSYRWYLLVRGRCMYLDAHDLCTIYNERTETCRAHNPPNCERFANFCDVLITTPDELDEHLNGE